MHASPHPFATARFGAGRRPATAQLYSRVGVETSVVDASPHKLVALLFDGLFESIARARAAMAAGSVPVKGAEIGRAVRIVDEGLRAGLDLRAGGTLARDLQALYDYVTVRLTQANLRNDVAALDECTALLQPLREAWTSIAPQVGAAAAR
jgi:flagellar secretion chaperone FliS